jgi:hypothetical protein
MAKVMKDTLDAGLAARGWVKQPDRSWDSEVWLYHEGDYTYSIDINALDHEATVETLTPNDATNHPVRLTDSIWIPFVEWLDGLDEWDRNR